VLGEPADVEQAAQGPPRADEVAVDVGAIADEEVVEVLRVGRGLADGQVCFVRGTL
jgi:hypothetical protein